MGGVKKHTEGTKKQISESMEGNKNAEVWTRERVLQILGEMWDYAREPYEIAIKSAETTGRNSFVKTEYTKRHIHLKSSLLIKMNIKNPRWFSEMGKKFKEDKTVFELLESIHMICENNTYNDATNGATNSNMAKMNLSTHFNWSDAMKNENNNNDSPSLDLSKLSSDELRKYLELSSKCISNKSGTSET
jgi:hypothetical protein